MSQAAYRINVDGTDVSSAFSPWLICIEITDSDGGKTDQCSITLDDTGGMIALPQPGATMEAMLWWQDPPPGASGGALQFTGVTDEPRSHGSRHAGRILTITAHSADLKGKGKQRRSKHFDQKSFADVAKDLGQTAGYDVTVDGELSAITRDYWVCAHQSFLSWGRRMAADLGATFKTAYPKAVFVSRNSAASASGASLTTVTATVGVNVISWDMAPALSRWLYKDAKARVYDHTKALWSEVSKSIGESGEVDHHDPYKHAFDDRAKNRAGSNADDCQRQQGGGHVEIDGEPAALAQAHLTLSGARPGIDGSYIIKTARHRYARHSGWTTTLDVELPAGSAGADTRGATDSGAGSAPATP
jgi:phage protein D